MSPFPTFQFKNWRLVRKYCHLNATIPAVKPTLLKSERENLNKESNMKILNDEKYKDGFEEENRIKTKVADLQNQSRNKSKKEEGKRKICTKDHGIEIDDLLKIDFNQTIDELKKENEVLKIRLDQMEKHIENDPTKGFGESVAKNSGSDAKEDKRTKEQKIRLLEKTVEQYKTESTNLKQLNKTMTNNYNQENEILRDQITFYVQKLKAYDEKVAQLNDQVVKFEKGYDEQYLKTKTCMIYLQKIQTKYDEKLEKQKILIEMLDDIIKECFNKNEGRTSNAQGEGLKSLKSSCSGSRFKPSNNNHRYNSSDDQSQSHDKRSLTTSKSKIQPSGTHYNTKSSYCKSCDNKKPKCTCEKELQEPSTEKWTLEEKIEYLELKFIDEPRDRILNRLLFENRQLRKLIEQEFVQSSENRFKKRIKTDKINNQSIIEPLNKTDQVVIELDVRNIQLDPLDETVHEKLEDKQGSHDRDIQKAIDVIKDLDIIRKDCRTENCELYCENSFELEDNHLGCAISIKFHSFANEMFRDSKKRGSEDHLNDNKLNETVEDDDETCDRLVDYTDEYSS